MAAVVPFLPWIAAGVTAVSAISQASATRKAADYNAATATRNAAVAREQAAADADAQGRRARIILGSARAAYGASGVAAEGSPIDVLAMSAANAELDKQNILYKGELRAMGYTDTAALERSRGRSATSQGYLGAASAFLTGASQYYSNQPAARPQRGYQWPNVEE